MKGELETAVNQSGGCRIWIWFCGSIWLLLFESICTLGIIYFHPGEQSRFPCRDLRISAAGWEGHNR